MVIFVLLLVATLNNASVAGEKTRSMMLEQLKSALEKFEAKGVRVENDARDPLVLLILVPENSLNFPLREYTISKPGSAFLEDFTPRLAEIVCDGGFRQQISSIVVEGHTDSSGTDEINLPLSQQRSLAVVQKMLSVLGKKQDGGRKCFLELVSATGRGSEDPRLDQHGQEDKTLSRRVEFKIRVRSGYERDIVSHLGT
jgi:chemotaxis protein MotB